MIDTQVMNKTAEAELLDLCRRTTEAAMEAGATGAEVFASRRQTREVAYEKNDLNLARADEELVVGIRVLHGQSIAFVTTNDPASAADAARQGVAIARVSPADPFNHLPGPADLVPAEGLFDAALATLGIEALTTLASRLVDDVKQADARITIDGVRMSVEEGIDAIFSSTGVSGSAHATYMSGFVMGMAIDGDEVGSFTFDGAAGSDRISVEAELERGVRRFVHKALAALKPHKGRNFTGRVILTPETVGDILVEPLLAAISADAIRKGRSPLRDKLGQAIASPLFAVRDPGTHLGAMRIQGFDREGLPIRPLDLVAGGTLQTFLYDSYEARVAGKSSTGHGRGPAKEPPRLASGLVEVMPGTVPAAELERSADLALVVPRFSGRVEMATGDFSGVVKGGFLVEKGERIPVGETMIAGNVYQALKSVEAVSSDRQDIFGSHLFPSVVLEGIHVTAG